MTIHQKMVIFFLKKRWKDTLNPVMLSLMIYEIILTFNVLIGSGGGGGGGGRGVLDILIVFIVFWRGHLSILKTMKCRNFRNITVNSLDAKRWICGCIHGKLVVYSSKVWSQNEIYSQCFGHSEQVKFVDLKYNIWKLRILAGRWTDLVTKLQNYIYEIWYLVEIEHANYEYGTWNWWPWPKIIGSSKFCLSNEICSNFYEILHSQQMEHANNIILAMV